VPILNDSRTKTTATIENHSNGGYQNVNLCTYHKEMFTPWQYMAMSIYVLYLPKGNVHLLVI